MIYTYRKNKKYLLSEGMSSFVSGNPVAPFDHSTILVEGLILERIDPYEERNKIFTRVPRTRRPDVV